MFFFRAKETTTKNKYLLISGVGISNRLDIPQGERPLPDYVRLVKELQLDIIDSYQVEKIQNPVVKLINRLLGMRWAIIFVALIYSRNYSAVLATGEDVGFGLALLFKLLPFRRIPLLVTCHNLVSRRSVFFLKRLKVVSGITRFLCSSQTQADVLVGHYQIKPEQIYFLYWHVDHNFFRPGPPAQIKRQISSTGMTARDYATLVGAVRGLEVEVKIDASSQWYTDQRLNIKPEDLPSNVEVKSSASLKEVRHLYDESLFVVVPLLDVPYSVGHTVILEAMAMGKAVVATKIKQHEDFIQDGFNGLYVAPGNQEQLRAKICYLLQNPDKTRQMGQQARQTVEERFTLDHYVQRVQLALQQAGATSPQKRPGLK